MGKGKSGGFRLYYLAESKGENIVLLTVYPKIGPNRKIDLKLREYEKLFAQFIDDYKSNALTIYDPKSG